MKNEMIVMKDNFKLQYKKFFIFPEQVHDKKHSIEMKRETYLKEILFKSKKKFLAISRSKKSREIFTARC